MCGFSSFPQKFRQTKLLISIAKQHGYSYEDIAQKCNSQIYMVKSWENGNRLALTKQIEPLIKELGNITIKTGEAANQ